MNKKLLIVAALAVLATACTPKQIIKTEYVERKVPVNSVPQPPKVEKPRSEMSQRERDSTIAASGLPGSGVVKKGMHLADIEARRAAVLDSVSSGN